MWMLLAFVFTPPVSALFYPQLRDKCWLLMTTNLSPIGRGGRRMSSFISGENVEAAPLWITVHRRSWPYFILTYEYLFETILWATIYCWKFDFLQNRRCSAQCSLSGWSMFGLTVGRFAGNVRIMSDCCNVCFCTAYCLRVSVWHRSQRP